MPGGTSRAFFEVLAAIVVCVAASGAALAQDMPPSAAQAAPAAQAPDPGAQRRKPPRNLNPLSRHLRSQHLPSRPRRISALLSSISWWRRSRSIPIRS
jgi:hypothetical protein